MRCSQKSPPERSEIAREPLAGGQVRDVSLPGNADLSDWVELMEVVEALCPVWPQAVVERNGGYVL
jgi:hypothetical protein